jgi:hypothetical protein
MCLHILFEIKVHGLKMFDLIFASRKDAFALQGLRENSDLVTRFPQMLRI